MQITIADHAKLVALGLTLATMQRALRDSHLILVNAAQRDYDKEKLHHTECDYSCSLHGCTLSDHQEELHRLHNVIEYSYVCHLLDVDPAEWLCHVLDAVANLPSMRWSDIRPVY